MPRASVASRQRDKQGRASRTKRPAYPLKSQEADRHGRDGVRTKTFGARIVVVHRHHTTGMERPIHACGLQRPSAPGVVVLLCGMDLGHV